MRCKSNISTFEELTMLKNSNYIFLLFTVLFFYCFDLKADDTINARAFHGDFSIRIRKNNSPYYALSPQASLIFIHQKISLDFGIGFLFSTNDRKIFNEKSWDIGIKFFVDSLAKKFIRHAGFNFQHLHYYYDVIMYDTAVPSIPVRATLTHEVTKNEISVHYGIRYFFIKRIYCEALAGITYSIFTDADPLLFSSFEKQKAQASMQLFGCIALGVLL